MEEKTLSFEEVGEYLSDIGIDPFSHGHVFTTVNLSDLNLTDINVLENFIHLHVRKKYYNSFYCLNNDCLHIIRIESNL